MLEAIAHIFAERRRMLEALYELGHKDPYEVEPRYFDGYTITGIRRSIGSPSDPFVIRTSDHREIARYYIEADGNQCRLRVSGSPDFLKMLDALAFKDGTVN